MSNCKCSGEACENNFDAREAYNHLYRKYTTLADIMAEYMAETGLERGLRVESASRLAQLLNRITKGRPTEAFPECCLVGNSNGFFCTGVLVDSRVVLTAAHCQDARITRVGLNCTTPNDRAIEIKNVQRVRVHPDYNPNTNINDIALLILPTPAITRPVPMATTQEFNASADVTLVGFGHNNFSGTSGFGLKREVSVSIGVHVDINQAEADLGFESDLEFTAGGKEGKDTCNGDSGGPAYIVAGGNLKVAGLTSRPFLTFENPCGEGGIYTRVDVHRDFIRTAAHDSGVNL